MFRIDRDNAVAPDLEREVVAEVVARRPNQGLDRHRMLARLFHEGQVDVVRGPVRIEAEQQRDAALHDPRVRRDREEPGEQTAIGHFSQPLLAFGRRVARLDAIAEGTSRRLRRSPWPAHAVGRRAATSARRLAER